MMNTLSNIHRYSKKGTELVMIFLQLIEFFPLFFMVPFYDFSSTVPSLQFYYSIQYILFLYILLSFTCSFFFFYYYNVCKSFKKIDKYINLNYIDARIILQI